jgi:hypothetical protein
MALPDDLWRECAAWLTRCKIIPVDHRFLRNQSFCAFRNDSSEIFFVLFTAHPEPTGANQRSKYWPSRSAMAFCSATSSTSLTQPWNRRISTSDREMHRYLWLLCFALKPEKKKFFRISFDTEKSRNSVPPPRHYGAKQPIREL